MRNKLIGLGIVALFLLSFATQTTASATDWYEWDHQEDVALDKSWTITFSKDIEKSSVSEETVYVQDQEGKRIDITYSYKNEQTLVVKPKHTYEHGKTYTLYISDAVVSNRSNQPLTKPIKMTFTTIQYELITLLANEERVVNVYDSFVEAKVNASLDHEQYIQTGSGVILWTDSGIATVTGPTTKILEIYSEPNHKGPLTYVTPGTELKFIDGDEFFSKVQIADTKGYVSRDRLSIKPESKVEQRSYYISNGTDLFHYIYSGNKYENYRVGPTPSFLTTGKKYYSWNGTTFGDDVAYQYFNRLPLRSKTNYTGEELDAAIKTLNPDSPLIGFGDTFKEAEELYDVNALYLLSHAILESGWGTSKIAQEKNNLFGLNAIDADPFRSADEFDSFEHSILDGAKYISTMYLTPNVGHYNGGFLGNKSLGMNVKYAADPYSGQKIAGAMYRLDVAGGELDRNYYDLALNTTRLNARRQANTLLAAPYFYREAGLSIILLEETYTDDELWYEIYPELPSLERAFVHGDYVVPIYTP